MFPFFFFPSSIESKKSKSAVAGGRSGPHSGAALSSSSPPPPPSAAPAHSYRFAPVRKSVTSWEARGKKRDFSAVVDALFAARRS